MSEQIKHMQDMSVSGDVVGPFGMEVVELFCERCNEVVAVFTAPLEVLVLMDEIHTHTIKDVIPWN